MIAGMSELPCMRSASAASPPAPPAGPPVPSAAPPAPPAALPAPPAAPPPAAAEEAFAKITLRHSSAPAPPAPPAPPRVCGENQHAALSACGVGSSLLALSFAVCRGLHEDRLRSCVDRVLEDARASSDVDMVKNLFMLAFQSRWCRGGKAERLVFYQFIVLLYGRFPNVVLDLVHLIPKYGYWKDLLSLLLQCSEQDSPLHAKVWTLFAEQLGRDLLELEAALKEERAPAISLCAKYAASEGGQHSKALHADKEISKLLFRGPQNAAQYRRMLSRLRKQLDITETHMCAQRWTEIDFAKVPSLCMDRQKHAFLGEKKNTACFVHPDDPVRQACREKFLALLVSGVDLKGQQVLPHELVAQVCWPRTRASRCSCGCPLFVLVSAAAADCSWRRRCSTEKAICRRASARCSMLSGRPCAAGFLRKSRLAKKSSRSPPPPSTSQTRCTRTGSAPKARGLPRCPSARTCSSTPLCQVAP